MAATGAPRRILLTADTVGGVWTYAAELAHALDARGVEVAVATMGAPLRRDQWRDLAGTRNVTVHESSYALEWMPEPWAQVDAAAEWLLELERELQPDVVHLNQFSFGALPWRAPRLVVGHSCVCSWWRAVHGTDAPADWAEYRRRVRAGLAQADVVAAPTRAMLAALDEHYGPLPPALAIPNGRDPQPFRPARKDELILAVGRLWDEAKNVAALARVAADLPWPVYVAGATRRPGGAASHPALADCGGARFLGQLPASMLARWMRRAAIYALPARYEPFGLSVLEAALAGCALVLGDVPSLRELWAGAALFVSPDDPDMLRAALRTLMLRQDLRVELADAANRRAQEFSVERFAGAYLDTYAALLAQQDAGRGMRQQHAGRGMRQGVACAS
ncbi:MAG TPA: glycosyltransferase family 4 protein [Gemmatimonadales bacterium]|nr:glycosyltransferase family 4 protein [Gemmatimonadales bacterium]